MTASSPTKSDIDSNESRTSASDASNTADNKKKDRKLVKQWLYCEARQECMTLVVGCMAMMASSVSNTLLPRFMGKLLDQKGGSSSSRSSTNGSCDATSFFSPTLSLLMVVVGGGTASFLRTTMLNRAEESIATRLRGKVFEALMTKKDLEWFQTERIRSDSDASTATTNSSSSDDTSSTLNNMKTGMTPGMIATVLNEDVTDVAHTMTATLANLFRSSISTVFSTYNMLRLNPQLFIASLFTVPMIGAAAMTMRKFLKRLTIQRKDQAMRAAAFAEERISQIAMVKMSNREVDEVEEYERMQDECKAIGRKESLANGAFMGFTFSATSSALFMVVHLGGRAVAAKRMTSGQLTSFATYSFLLGLAASGIVKSLGEVFSSMVGAKRVYDMIHGNEDDLLNKSEHPELEANVKVSTVESISLRNITFGYKARPDTQVLRNVSMELKRGSVVALVGKNGSGKTSIASLLAGLYKPQSGNITLLPDGANYNFLDRSVKKQLVQMVPQGAPLLNISILENVKYSKPDATDEEVEKALKSANCEGFISKLPEGSKFLVGMHGCKLSAGQRQRLALARALLSDPMLLILDEASSALDNEGENALADAVLACRVKEGGPEGHNGRALLLITHRPKSLEVADVVVVLREGQVVETGSFKDLKKKRTSALCSLMPDLLKL